VRAALAFAAVLLGAGLAAAGDWDQYGGDQGGQRYAALTQINRGNVGALHVAWRAHTGAAAWPAQARQRSKFEATPVLAGGKLLLCTPFNVVLALDPATGRTIWKYDPRIPTKDVTPANGFNCRGVSVWRDMSAKPEAACAERVFTGTNDYRLIALDLRDGRPCAGFGAGGEVRIDPGMTLKWPGEFQITSPPAVAGDTVIVGSAIGDNARVVAPRGVVHAYDARTGGPRWTFDPIPRTPRDPASATWQAGPPQEGHANVWSMMAVDEKRGLVFLPTSSPSPDFYGGLRPGDNRNADSVVALDAATGALRWAFQTVHHDLWDYDVPSQPLLATITHDGRDVDVVIQTTKTGLVFTLDRDTGAPVFPVEERRVPESDAEGEKTSPTQPFPVAPKPLVPTRLRAEDAYGFTSWDRGACKRMIEGARSEGIFTPPSTRGALVVPMTGGGVDWGGGAFDAATQTLFVNTNNAAHLVTLIPAAQVRAAAAREPDVEISSQEGAPYGMRRQVLRGPLGLPCNPPPWGQLHAIDMKTGAERWAMRLGTTEEIAPLWLALKTGTPNFGGPVATAGGLVFIGAAMDNYLRAFDAESGKELWAGKLPGGGQATPMTYQWNGRQYVVIASGRHYEVDSKFDDEVVAFALPRPGDPEESFWSKVLDQPGRRFIAICAGMILALGLLFGVGAALHARR
jgi:quinoprotein glucose dehydrogenase